MAVCSFFKDLPVPYVLFFIFISPFPLIWFVCIEMHHRVDANSRVLIGTYPSKPLPFPERCLNMRYQTTF